MTATGDVMITARHLDDSNADDVESGVFRRIDDKASKRRRQTNGGGSQPTPFLLGMHHDDAYMDRLEGQLWQQQQQQHHQPSPASDDQPVVTATRAASAAAPTTNPVPVRGQVSSSDSDVPSTTPRLREIVLRNMQKTTLTRAKTKRFIWAEALDSTASSEKRDEYFQAAVTQIHRRSLRQDSSDDAGDDAQTMQQEDPSGALVQVGSEDPPAGYHEVAFDEAAFHDETTPLVVTAGDRSSIQSSHKRKSVVAPRKSVVAPRKSVVAPRRSVAAQWLRQPSHAQGLFRETSTAVATVATATSMRGGGEEEEEMTTQTSFRQAPEFMPSNNNNYNKSSWFLATFYWGLAINGLTIACFASAWIVFYHLKNVKTDLLGHDILWSWWCNFLGRQLVTLQLAFIVQYILLDGLVLSNWTNWMVGHRLVVWALLSKQSFFSVVLMVWGFLDSVLLEGDDNLVQSWLNFFWKSNTLELYSGAEQIAYGQRILASDLYGHLLVVAMLVGLATSMKCTLLGIWLYRKTLKQFKPRLEKILNDMVTLSEVAELGIEAERWAQFLSNLPPPNPMPDLGSVAGFGAKKATDRSDAMRDSVLPSNRTKSEVVVSALGKVENDVELRALAANIDFDSKSIPDEEVNGDGGGSDGSTSDNNNDNVDNNDGGEPSLDLRRNVSGALLIRDLLDEWEDPVTKQQKAIPPIKEVLSFRRVLMLMDDVTPFGESFGPASNRDECIVSANRLFCRLLHLSSEDDDADDGANGTQKNNGHHHHHGRHHNHHHRNHHHPHTELEFDTIALLAHRSDGTVDKDKLDQLRKVFPPAGNKALTSLMFVQSCDTVYRKFRYFRASVSNSTVLDRAVERVMNIVFWGIVILMVLAYLGFNPWPILVSMSTLLVSFSFAMGSSAANFVEGVVLVLGRRPFDLGDRIVLLQPTQEYSTAQFPDTYFVTDMNLSYTTLTHAKSNATSTVKNGAISSIRIVNLNRSPNSTVFQKVPLSVKVLEPGNLETMRRIVEKYCMDHPRSWENLMDVRIDHLDWETEAVYVLFVVRHRVNWQDANGVLRDRGALNRFIFHQAKLNGWLYAKIPQPQIFYNGGSLIHGAAANIPRSDMLTIENVQNRGGADADALFNPGSSGRSTRSEGQADS